jgi:hypothetical protein
MIPHYFLESIQLSIAESDRLRECHRNQPEFGGRISAIDMHVWRLGRIMTREVKPVRAFQVHSRRETAVLISTQGAIRKQVHYQPVVGAKR